jgi:EPS-associated MarR family transcriptional regulator
MIFFFTDQQLNAIVQYMNNINDNRESEYLEILRKLRKDPKSSQRKLADELGFSLGKLNYCLKALQNKGLIKIKNFKKNPNKLNYFYVLTPKGIAQKTKLTISFMKKKMNEYDELKKEYDELKKEIN